MAMVDSKLYNFLMNEAVENNMCIDNGNVMAYTHIRFSDLEKFVEIVGVFGDEPMNVFMFSDTVCITLNDIFEGYGNGLLNYEECFGESTISEYRDRIIEQEQ